MKLKPKKRNKKKFIQQELKSLFRVKWELLKGPPLDRDGTKTGKTNIPALTEQDAEKQFLSTYNVGGRKFLVDSVTEITKFKPKQNHNKEHQGWDDVPV